MDLVRRAGGEYLITSISAVFYVYLVESEPPVISHIFTFAPRNESEKGVGGIHAKPQDLLAPIRLHYPLIRRYLIAVYSDQLSEQTEYSDV